MPAHICMLFQGDRHNSGQIFSVLEKCSHGNDHRELIVSDEFQSEES